MSPHKVNEWDLFLMENNMCDAICVTEHWLPLGVADTYCSSGWHVASNFSRTRNKRGGTMILSRNHEYEVLGKIVELSVEVDCEVAAIKKQGLTLISVYRSPVGDFNVCFNMNSNNVLDRNAEVLLEVFQSYGLKQTIYEPTRNNNCIDNIFVRG
ncbi:uncharacterized protein LOC123688091 [Harmonia axyridis]|uniref:uncharacterized protein LOC123688091 n=1 Tax=Harmonia axyridis TaxID=115357 RepID=UPI001E276837|nr:uncharacterized protein LOC123688091 [Harmonia axyridis]